VRVRLLLVCSIVATTLGVVASPAPAQSNEPRFCKAVADISLLFNTIDEEPTRAQQRRIDRLLTRAEQTAPSAVADAIATAADSVRENDIQSPEFAEAATAIDEWVAENCDYPVTEVTGRDYSFEGLPESLERGVNIFKFTNEGAELHEFLVVRIRGDETLEELLALSDEEGQRRTVFIGATFAEQGATTYLYANLARPGRYAALCFIPVGSTDEAAAESSDGPPHAAEGMATEFTVTRAR
jgi:hypothetical protein